MLATRSAAGKHRAQAKARAAGLETFPFPCAMHGPEALSNTQHGWCIECRAHSVETRQKKLVHKAARLFAMRSDPEAVAHMRALAVNGAATARLRSMKRPRPSPEALQDIAEFVKLYPPQATFDHIVPLKGKTVCGLHIWYNLQPTTGESNGSKSARFDPDRFPEQRPCNGFPGGQYHGAEGVEELGRFLRMDIPLYGSARDLMPEQPASRTRGHLKARGRPRAKRTSRSKCLTDRSLRPSPAP